MRRFSFFAIFASLWSALLVACGDNPSAEGPSTETSGIAARLLDSNGTPLAGAEIRAVAQDAGWRTQVARFGTPILSQGRTDAQGRIRLAIPPGTKAMLELSDTLLAARGEAIWGQDSLRELRASFGSTLRVRATNLPGGVRALRLAQTGYQASLQGDGSWLFRGVARGGYSVVARTDSGILFLGQVRLEVPRLDTVLEAETDSVLLEDFTGIQLRNRYGALLGSGWWFSTTDASQGGTSSTTPSNVQEARVPCADGYCLDVGFHLDPVRASRYAMVGVELDGSMLAGDTTRSADLSKVTNVRFRAAGGGNMLFQLAVQTPSGEVTACHAPIALGSDLATVDVALASLACDAPVADYRKVYGLTWTAISDGHLTLGRIWLVGAGPSSVFRGLSLR